MYKSYDERFKLAVSEAISVFESTGITGNTLAEGLSVTFAVDEAALKVAIRDARAAHDLGSGYSSKQTRQAEECIEIGFTTQGMKSFLEYAVRGYKFHNKFSKASR